MKRKKEWARKFLVLALTAAMTLQGPASALASDEPVTEQQSGEVQTELIQSGAANTGEPTAEGQTQLNADTPDAGDPGQPGSSDDAQDPSTADNGTTQDQPAADNGTTQDQSTAGDGTAQDQSTADNGAAQDQSAANDGTGEDQSMTGESETQQSESEETKSETLETGAPEEQESSEAQEFTEEQESSEVQESTEMEPAETQNTPDLTLPSNEPDGDVVGTESITEAGTDKTESETTPTETSAPEQSETPEETSVQTEAYVYTAQAENTQIRVKNLDEGVLPEGCSLTVATVEGVDDTAQTIAGQLHESGQMLLGVNMFDISIMNASGEPLHQLGGTVLVEMEGLSVPENTEQIYVYHVAEDGLEQVKSLAREELTDGVLRFETDHFSVYAVAYVMSETNAIMPMSVEIKEQDSDKTLSVTEDGNYTVMYDGENHWLTLRDIIGGGYEEIIKSASGIAITATHRDYKNNIDNTMDPSEKSNTDTKINEDGELEHHKHSTAGIYTYTVTVTTTGGTQYYKKTLSITRRPLYVVTPNITTYFYTNNHNGKVTGKKSACVLRGVSEEIKEYYGHYIFEWPDKYLDSNTFEVTEDSKQDQAIRIVNFEANKIGDENNLNASGEQDKDKNGKEKSKIVKYRDFEYIKKSKEESDTMYSIGVVENTLAGKDQIDISNSKLPEPNGEIEAVMGKETWKAENTFIVNTCNIKIINSSKDVSKNYLIQPLYGTLEIKPVGRVRYNYVISNADGSGVEKELSDEGFPLNYMPQLGGEEYDSAEEKPWIKSISTQIYRKGDKFQIPEAEPKSEEYTFIGWYDKIRDLPGDEGEQLGAMRMPNEECTYCYDGDDLYTLDAIWMYLDGENQEQIYNGKALALDDLEFDFTRGNLADEYWWELEEGKNGTRLIELGDIKWAWGDDAKDGDKWTTYKNGDTATYPSQVDVGVYPVTIKANAEVTMSDNSKVNKELKIVRYITIYPRPITVRVATSAYKFDGNTHTVKNNDDLLEYKIDPFNEVAKTGLVSGDDFASGKLDVIYYYLQKDGTKTEQSSVGERGYPTQTTKYQAEIDDTNLENQSIVLGEKTCEQLSGEGIILRSSGGSGSPEDVSKNYYLKLEPGTLTITPADNTLTISKAVTGKAGETDKEFTFTVTLDDEAASREYNYYGSSEGTVSNGGTITLKHGESVTIINLPDGVTYMVTETEANQDGYKTTGTNASGTVSSDKTNPSVVTFTNQRDGVTPELTVAKTLNRNGFDLKGSYEFSFTMLPKAGNPSGDPLADLSEGKVTRTVTVSAPTWSSVSDNFFDGLLFTKKGEYTYTLTEDPSTASGIVNDEVSSHIITVTVKAGENGSGKLAAEVKIDNVSANKVSFMNQYLPTGGLTVTKTVTGAGGDTKKEFDFTVTVGIDINGVYGDMTFVDGVSQFKLKHGGETKATGLPVGMKYSVTESKDDGYIIQKSGDSGIIREGVTAEAKFINEKTVTQVQTETVPPSTPPQTETDPPSVPSQTETDPPSVPPQTEADPPSTPSQTEAGQPGTPTQTEAGQPGTPSQTEAGQSSTPAQTEAGQPDTTPQTETETEKAKTGAKLTVTKSIVNESDRHLIGLDGATFYVALFSDAKLTQLASDIRELDFDLDTAVASVTYKNLKPGTYYVSEVNAKGKAVKSGQYGGGAYAAKYADDVQKVTIAKGDRAVEFAFENWFLELPDEQYYKDLGLPESKTESEPETEAGTEPETQADGTVPGDATAAKTGDGTPIGRMLLLLAVSGALLILTGKRRRRSRM